MKEKVLCSAIWYKSGRTVQHNPRNIETGIVLCGHRHANVLSQILAIQQITSDETPLEGDFVEGFLTNLNRFVTRKEAAKIALESKQIQRLKYSPEDLYSEDLY